MSFSTNTINVQTASPSLLLSSNTSQKKRNIKNVGNETIYLGSDNSVTTSNGFPLDSDDEINISDFNGTVYGIATTNITNVDVIEDE